MRRLIVLLLSLLALISLSAATVAAQGVHIVQRGDTLTNIASRYGVNLADLLQANGMTMNSVIHRGNQITIPGAGGSSGAPAPSAPAPAGNTVYTVQRGDFLALIAANHQTTYIHLAQLNGLTEPYLLHAGQLLIVPSIGGSAAPVAGAPAPAAPTTTASYTVQPGDSLAAIAAKYGINYFELARMNNLQNPDDINVGQVLIVPGPPEPAPAPAPAESGGAAPPPVTGPSVSGGFELGGQVAHFNKVNEMRQARMNWVKRQVRWGGQSADDFRSWIDHAHGLGFKILLSVVGDHNIHGRLAANPGQVYNEFAGFLAGLARHGADAIEVWNETNIGHEWPHGHINGANYTQMLAAAFNAIKSASPGTMVISAAPSPTGYWGGAGCGSDGCNDDTYIRQMAAAGAANYMDCVGVHWNNGFLPPTATTGGPSGHYSYYLPALTNLYRSVFPGKPLCFTEIGYVSPDGFQPLCQNFAWGNTTSVGEQAEWLRGTVNYLRGQNTRLMIVWNVDFTHWVTTDFGCDPQAGYAIVRPDGSCPACNTLRAAMGG